MKEIQSGPNARYGSQAGIAIGPILFIIAILAILAAAIAAGSGSFTAPTASEGNKTKAAGIISIGENLKIGMDRIVMENGLGWGAWNINATATSNTNDLFAPAGGGISPPSTSLAADPGNDLWYYPTGEIPDLGTSNGSNGNSSEQLAVLNVTQGVCNELNNKANGFVTPTGNDLGNFKSTTDLGTTPLAAWPANLNGKTIGCVQNTDSSSPGYFFYEVLYVQ